MKHSYIEIVEIFICENTFPDNSETVKLSHNPSKIKNADKFINKLTSIANDIELNNEICCQEQLKDPVLQQICQMRTQNNKNEKDIECRQSKAITSYINNFEKLSFVRNLNRIKEGSDDLDIEYLKTSTVLVFQGFPVNILQTVRTCWTRQNTC